MDHRRIEEKITQTPSVVPVPQGRPDKQQPPSPLCSLVLDPLFDV